MIDERTIRDLSSAEAVRRFMRSADGRLVEEMPIERSAARIDLAVIDHELTGIEIKSDLDDLTRLEGQAQHYAAVFDRLVIATTPKWMKRVLAQLPSWWGVWLVSCDPGRCANLTEVRAPRSNPECALGGKLRLLWSAEAELLLSRTAPETPIPRSRDARCALLAEQIPSDEIVPQICRALRARTDWLTA